MVDDNHVIAIGVIITTRSGGLDALRWLFLGTRDERSVFARLPRDLIVYLGRMMLNEMV